MQSILKIKYAIVLLIALNCVLLCAAQGSNGGWGGNSGAPGAPGSSSGRGAPGAPGSSGDGYYDRNDHAYSAAANNIGLAHLKWCMILMPFTLISKYI